MDIDPTATEIFRGLPSQALDRLSTLGKVECVAGGSSVFELGQEADKLYVVITGSVALTMPIEIRGVEQDAFVEELLAGGMFGWSALVSPHRYTMTARATVDSDLAVWSGADVRRLMGEEPATAARTLENLLQLICHRLHRMQAMWLRELQRTVSARLA